ncbi:hypothetical protein AYO21_03059 [Fonsecaea monophora]|uniref:Major facilitator superfamily (MFS) profile domain-containing protein n=1 Tax=Fonsecaea monophora TaxID=254056 RepID=A0A177FGE0_9EURO|nr:hypothetical protein AYO21_03059 [Fonsecaea monophora]KAH0840422.1 siderophore iron transporter [Fonsecaea pedrosoi]OAG42776.1 hypothetical protein AYO21_03059 [Fonsecaea monophora]
MDSTDEKKDSAELRHFEVKPEAVVSGGTEVTGAENGIPEKMNFRVMMALVALALNYEASLLSFILPSAVLLTINNAIGPSSSIGWAATSWTLVSGALVGMNGRLSDIFGRRKILIIGNVFGVVGTIVGSRANLVGQLIAAMTLLGVAASGQQLSYSAAFDIVPRKHRGTALAFMNLFSLPSSAFGAIIAFTIVENCGWRYTFYIGILANGLSLVFTVIFYHPPGFVGLHPDGKTIRQQLRELDYVGLFLFTGGLTVLLVGIGFGGNPYPWTSATVLAPLIIGAVTLIVAFPLWQVYGPGTEKLCPPHLIKRWRRFTLPLIINFTAGFTLYSMQVYWPQMVQFLFTTEQPRVGWLSFINNGAGVFAITWSGALFGLLKHTRFQYIFVVFAQAAFTASMASITQWTLARAVVLCIFTAQFTCAANIIGCLFLQFGAGDENLGVAVGLRNSISAAGGGIALAIFGSILNNKVSSNMVPTLAGAVTEAGLPATSVESFITAFLSGKPDLLLAVPGVDAEVLGAATIASRDVYGSAFRMIFLVTLAFGSVACIVSLFVPSVDKFLTLQTAVQLDKPHVIAHGEGEAKVLRIHTPDSDEESRKDDSAV